MSTPGPWVVKPEEVDDTGRWVSERIWSEVEEITVAEIRPGTGHDKANADLIAAAPELLARLKARVKEAWGDFPSDLRDEERERLDADEALIAKAEGRER